jgi:hypothetical protein
VPQDHQFFDLLQKQAETAHAAAHALSELVGDYHDIRDKVKKIKDLEHQGDELTRSVYAALNKTFIVPIDHADISTLASALDDVLDMTDHVSTLLVVYEIAKPTPAMVDLTNCLVDQTEELQNAIIALNHSRTYGKVSSYCDKIKKSEIKADEVYTTAVAALFKKTDAIEIIKQKEILETLETATDKADKAAQIISDIVMKYG